MLQPRESVYKRYIPGIVPEQDSHGPAYWFIFASGKLLIEESEGRASIPVAHGAEQLGIRPVRTQYLGTVEDRPCYTAEASYPEGETEAPEGMSFVPLRALYGAIDEDLFHLAGKAVQIIAWDETHQYCGRCGGQTVTSPKDRAKLCPKCGYASYPRLSPAVITAIVKGDKLLLARAKHFPENMYGLIAGFVEPGETLEDCVKRETLEEVGIRIGNIRYWGSQQWPFPNSLMIGFIADYEGGEIAVDGEEIVAADWFDADALPDIPPPISIARKIIEWYKEHYPRPNL